MHQNQITYANSKVIALLSTSSCVSLWLDYLLSHITQSVPTITGTLKVTPMPITYIVEL